MINLFVFFILFFIGSSLPTEPVPIITGSNITQEDAQAALNFHNQIRRNVDVWELKWSIELSAYAQEWADYLANNECKIKHRPHEGVYEQRYGENIFWGDGKEYTCTYASQRWFAEIENYHYGVLMENDLHAIGHYTQMVWRETNEIGIGIAKCSNGATIIVANYYPRGNTIGVLPY